MVNEVDGLCIILFPLNGFKDRGPFGVKKATTIERKAFPQVAFSGHKREDFHSWISEFRKMFELFV